MRRENYEWAQVGIRELKTPLSAYLHRVEAWETVTITGRIVLLDRPIESRLEALQQVGMIAWSGESLSPLAPVAQVQGERTVARLLLEDRE